MISSIDAKGQLRRFAYDLRDNITEVTDARANTTLIKYDKLDRPKMRTNPQDENWFFAYDLRDNRTETTKPDGVILTSTYDGLSRMTQMASTTPAGGIGAITRSYSYDPQSNILSASNYLDNVAGAALSFTYDQENRLATATTANLLAGGATNNVFTYIYDALDRRAVMTDSFGGSTGYVYDPVDRLTDITAPSGDVFEMNYDLAGRLLGRVAGNDTTLDRAYEEFSGRLAAQSQMNGDGTFNGFGYDYSDRGNILQISETGDTTRTKNYSYDALERLTEVSVPDAPFENETYELDPEGNRISSHLSDNHVTDSANRLISNDNYVYAYDANGNLITKTPQGVPTCRPGAMFMMRWISSFRPQRTARWLRELPL